MAAPPRRQLSVAQRIARENRWCIQSAQTDPATTTARGWYKRPPARYVHNQQTGQWRLRRRDPNLSALREIRHYQKSTCWLLEAKRVSLLVREVAQDFKQDLRFTADAIGALHWGLESWIVGLLADSYLCTTHAGRVTMKPKDMHVALQIRAEPMFMKVRGMDN